MTAKELIERLRRFPPDTEVRFDVKRIPILYVERVGVDLDSTGIKKVTLTLIP